MGGDANDANDQRGGEPRTTIRAVAVSCWLVRTSSRERRTLFAATAGYGLDGFDFMIYSFAIPALLAVFGVSAGEAGLVASASLVTSALGGWAAGILADRYGRVRVLQFTVAWFAIFTFLCGFSRSFGELLTARALQGFGFGGEWAVGAVLVAETVAARDRGKAAGLVQSGWAVGWALAALCFWATDAAFAPRIAWRVLFWLGITPALLIVYLRGRVEETAPRRRPVAAGGGRRVRATDIFRAPYRATTVRASLLCTGMMGAYYAITIWLPTYLKNDRHLSVLNTSGYLLVLIAGSFAGYLGGAWASDALGRRRGFAAFAACGIALVLVYTRMRVTDAVMLVLGFPLGFFLSGIFSGTGAYLAELFPAEIRGSGQGFCYNFGRAAGALCPALVGLRGGRGSLGASIGLVAAAAYGLVILAAWALPETRGRELAAAPDTT